MALADVQWFGVDSQGVLDFTYTVSVGITPGVATLHAPAGGTAPNMAGMLRFSDGIKGFSLSDCIVAPNGFREIRTAAGRIWELNILDRRWRWADGYAISGEYNQLDKQGKLIPWTIRSPFQLAVLLLDKMGEVGYFIDLPGGLAVTRIPGAPPAGPRDRRYRPPFDYLQLGQNFPGSGVNPRTSWSEIPAARALANLAADYGCVVVWDPGSDQVSVVPLGSGLGLANNGAMLMQSPGISPKQVPARIIAKGPPSRFQPRLRFRAVGREFDDSWRLHSDLSYAPEMTPQQMRVAFWGSNLVVNGVRFVAGTAGALAGFINSSTDPKIANVVSASVIEDAVVVTAVREGVEFEWDDAGEAICLAGPIAGGKGFTEIPPPNFFSVPATPQRTYLQNVQLAQSSIWKHWQLTIANPYDDSVGVFVPGTALKCTNRYLLILQDSCPEQIIPRPGDVNRIDPLTGAPYAEDIYNGYSKDSRPKTFGSIFRDLTPGSIWTRNNDLVFHNTPKKSRFYIPFKIVDAERQVVEFERPIYRVLGGEAGRRDNLKLPDGMSVGRAAILPTDLVIEMGVTVIDAATYSPIRFTMFRDIPGGIGPARTILMPDGAAEYIGVYDSQHRVTGLRRNDLYPEAAAAITLQAAAASYALTGVQQNQYVGIVPQPMTGVVRQVTYHLGRDGFTTIASANAEFEPNTLPLPARRRLENLPQDRVRALENLATDPVARNAQEKLGP